MKNSKFQMLYETIYNRFKQGAGFLEGDVVKLKSNFKSTESYNTLSDSVKQRLEDASKSGYNLRLGRLHTPNNNAGALGINVSLPATHADLYEEKSPGNFGNLVTVPVDLLEVIDTGVNLAPVSSNIKGLKSETPYQKPGKWKSNKDTPETEEQNHRGHKQNWAPDGDYELAEKNKKASVGTNKYDDNKPSKFKDLPIRESVVMEGLLNAYNKILIEDINIDGTLNITTPSDIEKDNDIETENMSVSAPDMAEDTEPGLAQGGNVVAPEEREQTSALEGATNADLPTEKDLDQMSDGDLIEVFRDIKTDAGEQWEQMIIPYIKSLDPQTQSRVKALFNKAAAEKRSNTMSEV